jgi:hypothetical protein
VTAVGAASAICVFDHDRYLNCLAAPFRRLIQTGEVDPWLAELWRLKNARFAPRVRRPFAFTPRADGQKRTHLTAELTMTADVTPFVVSWDDWDELGDLQSLFEFALLRYCVGERQWTGNATRPQFLLEFSYGEDDPPPLAPAALAELVRLCEELDSNGGMWTHGSGGFCEGVHGWLSPARTRELLAGLSQLPLPSPDLNWSQVVAQTAPNGAAAERLYERVRLARMRQIAEVAAAARGVLWGNDAYLHGDEPPPARIDPVWLGHADGAAVKLARAMRDGADFAALPVLADALEEAGCDDAEILLHCRGAGDHLWCCWVVDRVLEAASLP